jgi:hypothetical protein
MPLWLLMHIGNWLVVAACASPSKAYWVRGHCGRMVSVQSPDGQSEI